MCAGACVCLETWHDAAAAAAAALIVTHWCEMGRRAAGPALDPFRSAQTRCGVEVCGLGCDFPRHDGRFHQRLGSLAGLEGVELPHLIALLNELGCDLNTQPSKNDSLRS